MSVTDLTKDFYEDFTDDDGKVKTVENDDVSGCFHINQVDDLGNGTAASALHVKRLFDYVPVHILMPWMRALTAAVNGDKDVLAGNEKTLADYGNSIEALNSRLQAVLVVDALNAEAMEEILDFAGDEDTRIFLFERETGNAYYTSYRSVWDALSSGEPLKSLWDMDFDSEDAKATIQQALAAAEKAQAAAEAAAKQDQAGSVTNQKDSSALYFWSGTQAEYDAVKDRLPAGTHCYIEDDTTLPELWAAINGKAPAGNGYDGTEVQAVTVTRDSDGSLLEAALDELLAAMEVYSTRQIRVICTPYLEGYSYLVHVFKLADNDNAVVCGVGFRQEIKSWTKRKVSGEWAALEAQTLTEAEVLALIDSKAPGEYGLGKTFGKWIEDADAATVSGYFGLGGDALNGPDKFLSGGASALHMIARTSETTIMHHQEAFYAGLEARRHKTGRIENNPVWSEWEYVNPRMRVGVEYRTTERFAEQVVYTKMIECEAMTANGPKVVEHKANAAHVIRCSAFCTNGETLPNATTYVYAGLKYIHIVNNSASTARVYAQIWYIKTYLAE